jgi:hypothetical protein
MHFFITNKRLLLVKKFTVQGQFTNFGHFILTGSELKILVSCLIFR